MEIDNLTLAKAIDYINEWTIKYYSLETEKKPDPYKIQDELYKELNINFKYFEYAIRIMKSEGLIEFLSNDDEDDLIRAFKHTNKGLVLFLNGGMEKKIQENKKNKTLIQEQIESVIKTNKHQRVVLYLTLFVASITLVTQIKSNWITTSKNDNKPTTTIIDTLKVQLVDKPKNETNLIDSIKVE